MRLYDFFHAIADVFWKKYVDSIKKRAKHKWGFFFSFSFSKEKQRKHWKPDEMSWSSKQNLMKL